MLVLATIGASALYGTLVYRAARDGLVSAAVRTVGTVATDRRRQLLGAIRNERRRLAALVEGGGSCGTTAAGTPECAHALRLLAEGDLAHSGAVWRGGVRLFAFGPDSMNAQAAIPREGHLAELRGGKQPSLVIAVRSPDSATVVVLALGRQRLAELFRVDGELGKSGETFIADSRGRAASALRYPVVLSDSSAHEHDAIGAVPMRRCLQGTDGEMLAPDYHDAPIIHGFRYVPEVGGCIMAHISQPEALVLAGNLRGTVISAGLLLSLAALGLSVLVASSLSRPLDRLTVAAGALGAGDYTRPLPVDGPSEVRAVSRAFGAMADAVRDRTAALERSNADLDQFAYVASHDLKAPLRGIANLAQWLEEDLGDAVGPQSREHMHLLKGRVHRMEGLINGILQYARAGRSRDAVEQVPVGEIVAEAVELLAPPAALRIVTPDDLPVIESARAEILQIFLNLIGNAVKHAAMSRPDPVITIGWSVEGEMHRFSVTDNGPGIPPEFHDRIWQMFATLQARDTVESTGIGLSVVRKLVEHRGGSVSVRSVPGDGATFSFTWPIGPVSDA